jgi:integrase
MASIRQVEKPTGTRFYVYYRPVRGGKQKARVFRERADAEAFFREVDASNDDLGATPFSMFWSQYLRERGKRKLTDKVYRTYSRMGERLLVPFFRDKALREIQRRDIPKWMEWAESVAGAGTVEKAYTCLLAVLTYATDLDYIQTNPARGFGDHLPRVQNKRERPHLSTEQVVELSSQVHISFSAMILVQGILGLRPSEAIALRVKDLDLTKGVLQVRRSAVDVDGKMIARNETKTGKNRTIPMMGLESDFGAHLIDKYSLWEDWKEGVPIDEPDWETLIREHGDDILFTSRFSRSGGYVNLAALTKLVREAGERMGISGLAASDLRHSANANLLELTNDVTFASRILGNSPRINLDHYDAVTPTRSAEAIGKVSKAFARSHEATYRDV